MQEIKEKNEKQSGGCCSPALLFAKKLLPLPHEK